MIGTIHALSIQGEGGLMGNMVLKRLFRSLPETCFSMMTEHVNEPWRLNRRRPGDPGSRQENRRFAVPSSPSLRLRVGRDPASLQVTPSPRIHARRPGLWSTTQRFIAGPGHRF
ncbi:hypothetical protein [Lelliottia amnigena]|uniref:hypothetical protein n=1 Tax=Lelliottia amnigena TaxID=61646 RepID=UPI00293BD08C|nr:hypothetical protein [Lelliottia amnigena]